MKLSHEHHELQRSVKRWIDEQINPHVDAWEAAEIFPAHEVFGKLGALGYLGLTKPQVVLINKTLLAAGPTQTVFTQANLEKAFGGVLRHFQLVGANLHDDDDPRHLSVLTDDERPLVLYDGKSTIRGRVDEKDQ